MERRHWSAVSPWANVGASAAAIGGAAILWLIVTQAISCSLGGYLTGRLRTRWVSVHTDEVYFRDTANGFLAWAVGLVMTVTFLVSAATTMAGAREEKTSIDPNAYFVDRLFRSDPASAQPIDPAVQAEASRIFASTLRTNEAPADEDYLGKLVAARTGLTPTDARKRVSETLTDARQTENAASQTASHALLWIFLALLIGAFSASLSATIGGRQRDHVKAI